MSPDQSGIHPVIFAIVGGLVVGLLIGLWNFGLARFGKQRDTHASDQERLDTAFAELARRTDLLELKIGFFWRMIEENVALTLKKPIHLEMDALLDKFALHTITLAECHELYHWIDVVYLAPPEVLPQEKSRAVLVQTAVHALMVELECVSMVAMEGPPWLPASAS